MTSSSGRLLAFLDDDDEWLVDHVATLVAAWRTQPTYRVIESGHEGWRAGRLEYVHLPDPKRPRVAILKEPRQFPSAIAVERYAFDEVGGFDATLDRHQDWDLFIKLRRVSPTLAVERVTVRRDLHDAMPPRKRLELHRRMARRIKRELPSLTRREQLEVRVWTARTTVVRVLHVLVAGVAGDAFWRRLAQQTARLRRGRSETW